MGIKQMQGTSAFLEYIGPHSRKRRSWCAYNKEGKCHYTRSSTYMSKCVGRLYCQYFDDSSEARKDYKNEVEELRSYMSQRSEEIMKKKTKKKKKKKKNSTDNTAVNNVENQPTVNKHIIDRKFETKKVKLLSVETGKVRNIEIVADREANPLNQKYSEKSDMAQKIKEGKIGSTFSLNVYNKVKVFEIISIK